MKGDTFQHARRSRRLHLVAQALLVVTLFLGVNYLALRLPWRHAFAEDGRAGLAAETRAVLAALPQPVRVVSTLSEDDENPEVVRAAREVNRLLREMALAARGDGGARLTFFAVDVYRQRQQAEALGVSSPNFVSFAAEGAPPGSGRKLGLDELYETRHQQRTAFLGERVFLSALSEVAGDRRPRLYFLTGHSERSLADVDGRRGLSQLAEVLRQRHYATENLDLSQTRRVPDNAAMVLVLAPQAALLPAEQEALRDFLGRRNGRLLVMLEPGRPHGLDELFWDWGVLADDVLVVDPSPGAMSEAGELLVRNFGDHPITQQLATNGLGVLTGVARAVREDPGRRDDASLTITPLLLASDQSWGERHYRTREAFVRDASDVPGAVSIAAVSERRAATEAGVALPGGRLVAFGTGDLVSNQRIATLGNLTLFLSAINWSLGRDELLQIPPRPVERLQLALSEEQLGQLRLVLLVLLPGFFGVLGTLVYFVRRN